MKIVLQRVNKAEVIVNNDTIGKINRGYLLFIGVSEESNINRIEFMADKVLNLRVFENEQGKFDKSIKDIAGEILVISQFTLHANCKKGRRPDFFKSARPDKAIPHYEQFVNSLKNSGLKVETGKFGAHMDVKLINDGPVTIILDEVDFD